MIIPGAEYRQLIHRFPLRPLRSDNDLDAAIEVLNELIDRGDLATEEEDYMEVLGSLVHAYETEHHPMPKATPVAVLRYLLEENGLTQAHLAEQTGLAVATVSEILNGERRISPKARDALARRFKLSPALLVD
jgi:HTH-type transcriptional regulator / antitoxin HigA